MKKKVSLTTVGMRTDCYDRMKEWAKKQPLPPNLVDIMTLAVDRFLEKEKKK